MAREPGQIGCAAASLLRAEPLMATASRVHRWMLIEQPGAWGREALLESGLDPAIARAVRSRARRADVRVVLIRRPRWHPAETPRVYLVRSDRQIRWIHHIAAPESEALLDIDLSILTRAEPPSSDLPAPGSVHLVCTNGRHDACCADMGRPVVRALGDEAVDEVWESSHVGGDRFAANLVFLPSGVYYGRVPPEQAARLVRQHDEGILDLEYYRGRSCYQPLAQAGEIFVRRELDEPRIDALSLISATATDNDTSTLLFAGERAQVEVHIGREPGALERLTCEDHGASRPWQYRLLSLRRL